MADYDDPGWAIPFRSLIPFVGLLIARRMRTMDGLTATRIVFLALIAALLLFVVAISYVSPWDGGSEGLLPWAVVVIGAVSLVAVAHVRRRSLNLESSQVLAESHRSAFFTGIGFAHAPALFAVAGVFVGGSLWIYLAGLPFALAGMALIAPTRHNIEWKQRGIDALGSPLSLGRDIMDSTLPGRN